jgi:hypothetical protein
MAGRYRLWDDQWEPVKDLLPGWEGHAGLKAKDNRLFVEAVLHRYRGTSRGGTCRSVSGLSGVVQTRHSRWSKAGVRRLFEALAGDGGQRIRLDRRDHRARPLA